MLLQIKALILIHSDLLETGSVTQVKHFLKPTLIVLTLFSQISFPTIDTSLLASIPLPVSPPLGALEPVTNLQLNLNVSPAIIKWTASSSDQACIDGYQVCWTVTTYLNDAESTNLTCHNVTKDVTSSNYIGQPYYCINYIAIVVTFGSGLRSQSINTNETALTIPPIDSTMIHSLVVEDITSTQVTFSWEPVYQGSPCATHYRVCHREQNSTVEPDCSNECFITNQELASVDMWEGVNLVWFVDDGGAGVQIPTGYTEIKMLFFTVVFVFAGTVLVKCQNCTELEPVSGLSLNVSTSPAIIEWTASNSSQECVEGYEVCLAVTTHHNTTASCINVTAEVTSFTAIQQIQHCVDYTATVTAFSIDGLRSNPVLTTHLYYPEFFIDNVINISRTVNSSSIILEAHTLPSYSLCTIHMVACMEAEFGSMCLDGTETEVKLEAHELFACTYYNTGFYVTTLVESTMSDILQIHTNNSETALIESVTVGIINPSNVTLSWQPVYLMSPCLSNYRVCHLEQNSLGEPSCSTLSSNLTTTILSDLKTLTDYTVNVSAIFPDETDSDVISITFRTSGPALDPRRFQISCEAVSLERGKTQPLEDNTPDRDLNLDLPVIGSLIYFESITLDHVTTGVVA
uniref:Fibronectin type-III domain-containing protein n=1 Tax=Timema bartmani TaxID=61472 RepID=A0A7R9F325_9NEOP|nr:unnamed protein product [Timema bartmani]